MSKNNQQGTPSSQSASTRAFNALKKLFGLDPSAKGSSPQQSGTKAALQMPAIMSGTLAKATVSPQGFKVRVDAAPESADHIGSLIVEALGLKRDRGGFTAIDYPPEEIVSEKPLVTVSLIDTKGSDPSRVSAAQRTSDLAGDNEIQGTLTTLTSLFGKDLRSLQPGKSQSWTLLELFQAPGASALNVLGGLLPALEVTEDAGFILLFSEAIMRRTDMGMIDLYLTKATLGGSNDSIK